MLHPKSNAQKKGWSQIKSSFLIHLSSLGYLHVTLLLVGTTTGWRRGFLTMSCQWIVSAWHRNLFWSTYTPPLRISVEKRERTVNTDTHRAPWVLNCFAWRMHLIQQSCYQAPDVIFNCQLFPPYHFRINNWHGQTLHVQIKIIRLDRHFILFFPSEGRSRVRGLGGSSWSWDKHTLPLLQPLIFSHFCCFSHPSIPTVRADRINYASQPSQHRIHPGLSPSKGQQP